MRCSRLDRIPVHAGQRRTILGDAPLIHPRQMVITRKRRANGRVRPAGIGRGFTVKIRCQPRQHRGVLGCGPVFWSHISLLAGFATTACQAPIFHLGDIIRVHPLKAAMRRNDRLYKKLRAAAARDLCLGWRLAGLVVENSKPATGKPVDPVGPRTKSHITGWRGQINAALDLGMACLDAGTAAGLGLDEPGRDGLEGGPPEMPDGRMLPVWIERGARQ